MKWRKASNLIIALVLSIIYTIVTFLTIITPLHMNKTGLMNHLNAHSLYWIIYWMIALFITWSVYFALQNKPKILFFILIIIGIIIILFENFLMAG